MCEVIPIPLDGYDFFYRIPCEDSPVWDIPIYIEDLKWKADHGWPMVAFGPYRNSGYAFRTILGTTWMNDFAVDADTVKTAVIDRYGRPHLHSDDGHSGGGFWSDFLGLGCWRDRQHCMDRCRHDADFWKQAIMPPQELYAYLPQTFYDFGGRFQWDTLPESERRTWASERMQRLMANAESKYLEDENTTTFRIFQRLKDFMADLDPAMYLAARNLVQVQLDLF